MDEVWIVQTTRTDKAGYVMGVPYNKVGPFASRKEAVAWIDEVYPLIPGTGKREGIKKSEVISPVNLLSWVYSPAEGRKRALR